MDGNIRIKSIISQICKKCNILYSGETDIKNIPADVELIGKVIFKLREIQDILRIIEDKHDLEGIKVILEDDINELAKVAHDLGNAALKIQFEDKLK